MSPRIRQKPAHDEHSDPTSEEITAMALDVANVGSSPLAEKYPEVWRAMKAEYEALPKGAVWWIEDS